MPGNDIQLIFVYNADSGLFNTVSDIAHKIFSPQTYSCGLCALTHSYFSMRQEWKTFIETLGVNCRFMHRDEFITEYPDQDYDWPVVLIKSHNQLNICLESADINKCNDLDELKSLIRQNCYSQV